MAAVSSPEKMDLLPISSSLRMSTTFTSGSGLPLARRFISIRSSLFCGFTPGMARIYVDMDGVALPRISTPFALSMRCHAISRASYRGRLSER